MATRLYFHNASNALSGTFPAGEQSALTANYTATGATTLKTMNTTIGAGQSSMAGASLAQTASQNGFYGFFSSPAFASNQTVGGGGQTITLNIANQQNSLFMDIGANLQCCTYVWRPSTGAKVGDVVANLTMTGCLEPNGTTEKVNQGTTTSSSSVSAQTGDVLICEVWQVHTQTNATSRTGTFYYDGTTVTTVVNTTVTNHAAFLDFSSDTMSFAGGPVVGTFSNTFDGVGFSSAASIVAGAAFNSTFGGLNLVSQLLMASSADFNNTFDGLSLSASMATVFTADANFTLDGPGLTADASMTGLAVDCNFNSTFDGLGLSAAASTVVVMGLNAAFDSLPLVAAATFDLNFSATFAVTFQGLGFSSAVFIIPQSVPGGSMNDALYRWLGNRGFTGTLEDRVKQYLVAQTTGTGLEAIEDLWITFGATSGYGKGIQEIQMNWAIDQGATSTLTWSDAMGSLPV